MQATFVRSLRAGLAALIMSAAVCAAYAAERKMDEATIQGFAADAGHVKLWRQLQARHYKLSVSPGRMFKEFLSKDKNTWIVISVSDEDPKAHKLKIWMYVTDFTKPGFRTMREPFSVPDAKVMETLALYETEAKNAIAAANKVYDDAPWWKF